MKEHYLKKELYELIRSDAAIFDFIQNVALDGLWFWDVERPEEEWMNPKFWEVLGYDHREMLHKTASWQEFIFPEDLRRTRYNTKKHLEDPNHPYDHVVRYRHKQGHTLWIRCRGKAIRDESGRALRMIGAHIDVTEETLAAIQSQKDNATLHAILNKKSVYVIKTDMEGKYTYMNDYFCERLHIRREDALGKNSMVHIIPEDHEKCFQLVHRCIRNPGKTYSVILRKPHPEGGYFTNEWEFTAITDEKGVPYEFLCVGKDMTARQQFENAVQSLFSISNDLMAVATFEGKFEYINPEWQRVTGRSSTTLKQEPFINFVHPDDRERTQEEFEALLRNKGQAIRFRNRYQHQQGHYVWLEWNAAVDYGNQKIYAVARDITKKHQRAQLQKRINASTLKLSKESTLQNMNYGQFLESLVQEAAQVLEVPRFSVWDYKPEGAYISCVILYDEQRGFSSGQRLNILQVPEYFEALRQERTIKIADAKNDTRTQGLDAYLEEFQVAALLDTQIRPGDQPNGVLCAEHHQVRTWTDTESNYMNALAEIIAVAQAVESRKKSEAKYRLLAENNSDAIIAFDGQYDLLYVSPSFHRLLGYQDHELSTPEENLNFIHPEDRPRVREALQKAERENQEFFGFEGRIRHKDGHYVWIENKIRRTYDSQGQLLQSTNSLRDITKRKRTQQALRQSEERYRTMVSAMSEGVVVHALDDSILMANEAATEILGLSIEQLTGKDSYDPGWRATHADGTPLKPEQHPSVVTAQTGKPVNDFLMQVNTGKGERRLISINSRAIENDDGKMYGVVVSFTDVTKEKEALEKLYRSNQFLRMAQKASQTGHYRFFPEENRWEGSEALLEIFGIDKSYPTTIESWLRLIHPEERQEVARYMKEEVLAKKKPFQRTYRVIHQRTGEVRWVEGTGSLSQDEGNHTLEMFGVIRDITQRHEREQALAEARDTIKGMADNLPGMIFQYILHPDGTDSMPFVSKGIEQLFEVSAEDSQRDISLVWDRVHPEDYEYVREKTGNSAKTLTNWTCEFRLIMPDGRIKWVLGKGTPRREPDGSTFWNSVTLDITQQKEAENALRKSEQMLSNVADNIQGAILRYVHYQDGSISLEFLSRGVESVWEVPYEEALQNIYATWEKVHPEDMDGVTESIQKALAENKPWNHTFRAVMEDGRVKWINGRGTFTKLSGGATLWYTIGLDITAQKEVAIQLEESQRLLNSINQNIKEGIYRASNQGLIYANDAFARLFGYTSTDEIMQVDSRTFYESAEQRERLQQELFKKGEYMDKEVQFYRKDGTTFWASVSVTQSRNEKGEVIFDGSVRDITARKEAEEALQKSQQLLSSINQNITEGIYRSDLNGLLYTNDAFARMFGYASAEEMLAADVSSLYAEADERLRLHEKVMELGSYTNQQVQMRKKDGTLFWVSASTTCIETPDGQLVFDGAVRDITEQKKAEEELRESEQRFRFLVEKITDIVVLWDKDYNYEYISPAIEHVMGYTLEEYRQFGLFDNVPEADHHLIRKAMQELAEGVNEVYVEHRVRAKDGRLIWLRNRTKAFRDKDGNLLKVLTTSSDITLRRKAEEEALRLAKIAERTTDVLLTCDSEGVITWCNTAIRKMLGFEPEDIIGFKPTAKLRGTGTKTEKLVKLEQALIEKRLFNDTLLLYHRNGSKRWINYETKPAFSEKGRFLYTIVTKRDLTEVIEKQQELERLLQTTTEQNTRLKEFSYITSHNLRSSVANLLGLTALMNTDPGNPTYVDMINQSTQKLDVTIRNINTLLQVESNMELMGKEPCNLRDIVERVLEQQSGVIREKAVNLKVSIGPDFLVDAIPVYLESIIQNLITNALKYGITNTSKDLHISAKTEDSEVCLTVTDYGYGIDLQKYGHRLFKLGTRLHDISSGQGLGLYMSQRQAEVLNGRLLVDSEPFKGASFTLCLPAALPQ